MGFSIGVSGVQEY